MKKNIEHIKPLTDREVSIALKNFTETLLHMKSNLMYLGIDVAEVEVKLDKTDWQFLNRELKYDKNGKAIKFLKEVEGDGVSFELCGIKLMY